jgi:hypothetical protein
MDQFAPKETIGVSKKLKAGFYTILIFSIIVFIWVYTNPFFKKQEKQNQKPVINDDVAGQASSIGQSFKTTWQEVSGGLKQLKK